jgi:hypothetical protein
MFVFCCKVNGHAPDNSLHFPAGARGRIPIFAARSRPALGPTQPLIPWVPGVLSPGLKRQRREADNFLQSINEIKMHGTSCNLSLHASGVQHHPCGPPLSPGKKFDLSLNHVYEHTNY